jgi:hypothetical protein
VVFIVFNRPDLTAKVFERIREARPERLLVVCDGPRKEVATDLERVAAVRALIDQGVDWPCQVDRNYAESNLGCRQRVASGLNWVFSLVEEAIILEDDCLPDPSFFPYCEEMLDRYRDNPEVMHINGTNFVSRSCSVPTSYFFSKYVWVWGWATWRRAWEQYDYEMQTWEAKFRAFDSMFDTARERAFWLTTFNAARADPRQGDTWDFAWIYSCWVRKGLAVCPQENLVQNIGFGSDSTHTTAADRRLSIPATSLRIERHPARVSRSRSRDDLIFRFYHNGDVRRASSPDVSLRILKETCQRYFRRAGQATAVIP